MEPTNENSNLVADPPSEVKSAPSLVMPHLSAQLTPVSPSPIETVLKNHNAEIDRAHASLSVLEEKLLSVLKEDTSNKEVILPNVPGESSLVAGIHDASNGVATLEARIQSLISRLEV